MAIIYTIEGNKIEVAMNWDTFIPDFTKIKTIVILVAFMLSYLGIEASAVHVNELDNAKKNYPIAIMILAFGAIVMNIFGALSVGFVVPIDKIELNVVRSILVLIMNLFEIQKTKYRSEQEVFDWIIDLGPEGGPDGGRVVATGTPEQIASLEDNHTGRFLCPVLAGGP
jgi:hypothetical protein